MNDKLPTPSCGWIERLRNACRLREESGQSIVAAALSMTVLLGFLGLAIDGGQLRYQKRRMQMAADAAAQAGALEVTACGSRLNCSAMKTAAQTALTENGLTGSSLLTNCATRGGTTLEISVNNPPCAVASDPNAGVGGVVEVIVSRPVSTVFAKLVGISSVPILARAEAEQVNATCLYVLDPGQSNALVFDSNTTTTAACNLLVESTSSSSAQCTNAAVDATAITLVGSGSYSNCTGNVAPITNAPVPNPADPLASLTKPTVPSCGSSTQTPYNGTSSALTITGTAVLYPTHAYCGGITIKSGANVTFQPGTYVLGSSSAAGGLSIDVNATVTGSGVTIYNYGTSGAISLSYTSYTSGGVSLIAPTTGTYTGVLFFQDPRNTNQATLLGSSSWNTVLQGGYYFPTAKVLYTYSGTVAYNFLDAYDVEFAYSGSAGTGASSFYSNYASLVGGVPLGNVSVAVVE